MSDTNIPPPLSGTASSPASGAETSTSNTVPLFVGPSWQEQDGILRDLWMQNKTPQEISAALERSVAAIMTRAARLGLPRRSAPGRKPGSRRMPDDANRARQSAPRTTTRAASEHDTPIAQPSARICLMCLRSFASQGRHNRICPSCKGSTQYEAAVSLADVHFPV